ncbi:MAG TPA: aminoglycoside phosphotransferase, partial [Alphaproteobacteria bacterium]|nr:aminoglycoside phosphotransferase [Alphaproteobacteria bacterium]
HAIGWQRPDPFARLEWNDETVFGPAPIWGDWRVGPGVTGAEMAVLERAETVLRSR